MKLFTLPAGGVPTPRLLSFGFYPVIGGLSGQNPTDTWCEVEPKGQHPSGKPFVFLYFITTKISLSAYFFSSLTTFYTTPTVLPEIQHLIYQQNEAILKLDFAQPPQFCYYTTILQLILKN
jgi:hypothetical protein